MHVVAATAVDAHAGSDPRSIQVSKDDGEAPTWEEFFADVRNGNWLAARAVLEVDPRVVLREAAVQAALLPHYHDCDHDGRWQAKTELDCDAWAAHAWTQVVSRIPAYERDGHRIRVTVDLVPGQSAIVALAAPGPGPAVAVLPVPGRGVVLHGERPTLRMTSAGSYLHLDQRRYDGGRCPTSQAADHSGAVEPRDEDWKPVDATDPPISSPRSPSHG